MSENSWERISKDTTIKNLDYSSFKHKTTVIPIPFYEFFNLDIKSNEKVYFDLIADDNQKFPVYVRHADKSRTTPAKLLCWNKEFNNYLQNKYPQWETISTFSKTSAFKLTFIKLENQDAFLIDTNEETYLKNLVFDSVLDKLDENLSAITDENTKESSKISLTPVEYSEEDIQVSAKQASVRQRKELKLQNKFIDNLKSKGYKTSSSRVDIVAKKNNEIHFIEAKILTSQTKAAQALGQLLFYEYKVSQEDKPTSLFLLFDKKPEKETIDFVKQYKVTIIYESGDSFKQIDWDS